MSGRRFWGRGLRRRSVLSGGVAGLGGIAGLLASASVHAEQTEALTRLAAQKGLRYGTTISAAQIIRDPTFVALLLQQAGLVVPENDMKWLDMNRGAPGDDDYGPADTVAGFAVEGGLALRGHNLLWYYRTPHWFFTLPGRDAQRRAVVDRIRALAGRYRGIIHSWDVVNEPIEPKDGRTDGLRRAVFLDALGPEYLDLAYRTARETDPEGAPRRQRIRCRTRLARARSPPHRPAQSAAAHAAVGYASRRGRHSGASDGSRRAAVFAGACCDDFCPTSPASA